jgi:hypothetical protein
MYGDMTPLTHDSAAMRVLATDTRERGVQLAAAVGTTWVSSAAAKYSQSLADRSYDFGVAAQALDEAADALDAHVRSVEERKQAIVAAEAFVSDRWHDATRLVGNVVESVESGVATVFHFFGAAVPDYLVHQAHDIVHTLPALPTPGSKDWLDALDTFHRRGW